MKYCSVNGQQQTTIALTDRGLAYGDGLFTTAKIVNGQVILLAKHIERLVVGCQRLKLPLAFIQHLHTQLSQQLPNVASTFSLAVLKVMITTGSGGRGYSRIGLNDNAMNIIITVSDFPEHYPELAQKGITLGDSEQQLGTSTMLAGLKHLNRLEQVLLRAELDERIEDDLVVTNNQGYVVEATSANVFYWLDDQLSTPDLSMSGVNGIIRQTIIAQNPKIKICQSKLSDLKEVQGMFICNALMGIIPVKTYNNRHLAVEAVQQIQQRMQGMI
ncbi:aminodeoxychorismate lyase [Colwellia ponticola]|uniref:Aminodeoxychorismate lyase n=1 Tax=Colwellia ponticola TaxID=2304625 RepID=A0A8H2JLS9_9GAMM|nr:aminodeoxychorismate lyase [Colwellia ponticola]TMM43297.1 aminodeoxychorismate lyase [Colwellia ponticola]